MKRNNYLSKLKEKTIMKDLFNQLMKELRGIVKNNLQEIKASENLVRDILNEPQSEIRDQMLRDRYGYNKELLDENNDAINLQLAMVKFYSKYKHLFEPEFNSREEAQENEAISGYVENKTQFKEDSAEMYFSREEYFELTVKGELEFSSTHPYFSDMSFINDLINHYIVIEEYEKCSMLKKQLQTEDNI